MKVYPTPYGLPEFGGGGFVLRCSNCSDPAEWVTPPSLCLIVRLFLCCSHSRQSGHGALSVRADRCLKA
jgi:hypothetical protein